MKKIKIWWVSVLLVAFIGISVSSCGLLQKVVVKEEIHHTYRDSLILNIKDSINVIPVERYVDIVPDYDTLKLETSLAQAQAYVDTSKHQLKGEIKNKNTFTQQIKTEYKYITKVDSVYIKEPVPYPVIEYKVPKWCWWNLVYSILLTAGLILFILKKFKIFGF